MEIGYSPSSEEHTPRDLVRQAKAAEASGFTFALISDHLYENGVLAVAARRLEATPT